MTTQFNGLMEHLDKRFPNTIQIPPETPHLEFVRRAAHQEVIRAVEKYFTGKTR